MRSLQLTITLFLISGCATTSFSSGNNIPVSFVDQEEHTKKVNLEVETSYFLWGLAPRNYSIQVDEIFMRKGYQSVANLKVQQRPSFTNSILAFLTLGFYIPQTLILEGKVNPYRINEK